MSVSRKYWSNESDYIWTPKITMIDGNLFTVESKGQNIEVCFPCSWFYRK